MQHVFKRFPRLAAIALFGISSGAHVIAAPSLRTAPVKSTVSTAGLPLAGWNYEFDGDKLENTWSWTAQIEPAANGTPWEARVPFHYRDAQNYYLLQLTGSGKNLGVAFWHVASGKATPWGEAPITLAGANQKGQLTLQRSNWQARALWNGRVILSAFGAQNGSQADGEIGAAARGAKLSGARLQPTEPVVAQDDFMRADGPGGDGMPKDEASETEDVVLGKRVRATEIISPPAKSGEWRTISGSWKTSMMIDARVRFDSSRNPNPFVYRAESKGSGPAMAATGKWFWSNYSVAVAFKPVLKSTGAPLVAAVAAYAQPNGQAVIGEVDLRSGRAALKQGAQTLAQSEAFACAPNQWHRLLLEPGPGTMRLLVDGIERVRFTPQNFKNWQERPYAQGEALLRAELGGGNFVDFDDVNIEANSPLSDDFTSVTAGRWENLSGTWQTRPGQPGTLVKTTNGEGISVTGEAHRDGLLEAEFARERAGKNTGLIFALRDKQNYFLARQTPAALEIVEVIEGKTRLLAQTSLRVAGQPFGAHPLSVEWQDGAIKARLGFPNAANFTAIALVNSIPAGRTGLWADGASGAVATAFRSLSAAPTWGEPPVPARFQKDRLMRFWASNAGAWRRVNPDPDFSNVWFEVPSEAMKKNPEQIWMHTGDFFRDAEMTVPLPNMTPEARMIVQLRENFEGIPVGNQSRILRRLFTKAPPQNATASKDSTPKTDKATAVQELQPGGASLEIQRVGDNWQFKLSEGGKLIKTVTAPYEKPKDADPVYNPAGTLRFVRRPLGGKQVAISVTLNDKVLIEETAPESAAGTKILVRLLNIESISEAPEKLLSSAFWFERAEASTSARLDYTFTGAPVDWFAARGRWEVAERWTCQPQWGFMRGYDDVDPTLWSRFAPQGDWTLEAYLATPMDQTRSEHSPTDINVTVEADGRNLGSGYSFIFAPRHQAPHYIMRGDQLAVKTANVMPSLYGGEHQDWYYVRIERRRTPQGLRFRWYVNNQEIADYLDDKPLNETAGRIAFWSHNFNLSIARVRLWHDGLETTKEEGAAKTEAAPIKNALDAWTARRYGLQEVTAKIEPVAGQPETLKVTNPENGGDWTVYVSRKPFDAEKHPNIRFSYRMPQGVFVNVYVKIGGRWREIIFTGDFTTGGLPQELLSGDGSIRIGKFENVRTDNEWHDATFNLKKALKDAGLDMQVEALAFAAPERGYLRAGIGGNHQGATYMLRDFQMPLADGTSSTAVAALNIVR